MQMFFAPPKVKSLSRYAEYGSYLSNRHFLVMLAIAITVHLAIIAVYSMIPTEEVVRIPVRPLNIKLTGGSIGNMHVAASPIVASPAKPVATPPAAPQPPAPEPSAATSSDDDLESVRENTPESAVDKALTEKPAQLHPPAHVMKVPLVKAPRPARGKQKGSHASSREAFATPKKYVRDAEAAAEKKTQGNGGNGSTINGVEGGQEVITRYTQIISQWIGNHQAMAKAACGEAKQVTGTCNAKGQATVRLRINREGHIISNTVEHTSGSELVDQAAIVMVRASDPVPSVPNDYPSDTQLEFLIPVQVDLTAK